MSVNTTQIHATEFRGVTDLSARPSFLTTDQRLEYVEFNNNILLRTLTRLDEDRVIYYEYSARTPDRFDPATRKIFGGPYDKLSADPLEVEIFELIDSRLRLQGL